MGREFELKYHAEPEQMEAIREKYGSFHTLEMKTVYYDTPSGKLKNRRWTLRRRMENGEPVCTVKTAPENGGRGEWETVCPDIESAVPILIEMGAPAELAELASEGLMEICGVRFVRLAAQLPAGDGLVELALDRGEFLSEKRNRPFAEVEVELKQGMDQDALNFAETLAAEFHLTPEPKSKFKRALELAAESN